MVNIFSIGSITRTLSNRLKETEKRVAFRKSDAGGVAMVPAGHIKQYITVFIFHEQQTWTTVKQKLKV